VYSFNYLSEKVQTLTGEVLKGIMDGCYGTVPLQLYTSYIYSDNIIDNTMIQVRLTWKKEFLAENSQKIKFLLSEIKITCIKKS